MNIKQVYQIDVSLYKVVTDQLELTVIADTSDEAKNFLVKHLKDRQRVLSIHLKEKGGNMKTNKKTKKETKLIEKRFKELSLKIALKEKLKAEMRAKLNSKYPAMNFHEVI